VVPPFSPSTAATQSTFLSTPVAWSFVDEFSTTAAVTFADSAGSFSTVLR
jgi:hypothetical protein